MFYWDELLDCIALKRNIVPVIGCDLLTVLGDDGAQIPFSADLARRCADLLKKQSVDVSVDTPFQRQMKLALESGIDFASTLYSAHQALLAEFSAVSPLPEPLRLLREISDFPFFVSTTTDGLLAKALRLREDQILAAQVGQAVDLPLGWQPGMSPKLFHLFGRIAAGGDAAITEEDVLEYFAHLHDKGRPVRLLAYLRQSHLLFLGNSFPDWLARVFFRLLRDERFAGGKKAAFDAVADPEARGKTPLVGFLRAFSPKTRIYDEGDGAHFIRTLHAKWLERNNSITQKKTITEGDGNIEPEPMNEAAIFISYGSENRTAAETLAAALSSQHLPVWLDRRNLKGGDNYSHKIEENIRQCRLFVPLLSKQTSKRHEGWFRREWQKARERLDTIGPELTFVIPVLIDDSQVEGQPDLARYFTLAGHAPHVLQCPAGLPKADLLEEFVTIFRAATRKADSL